MDKTGPRVSCLLINGPFQSHEPLEPFPWQFPLCKHPGHCMYMYRPLRILFIFLQIVSFGHLYAAAWCSSSKSKESFRRCFSFLSPHTMMERCSPWHTAPTLRKKIVYCCCFSLSFSSFFSLLYRGERMGELDSLSNALRRRRGINWLPRKGI
jgi:hypothetical protein